ncbi:hypothetical protein [Crossiella sp. CA198]|uniref:hypothetical protein n=1 Tax=Crossiella sp. CA198 TaxID=3455607 RepID=UPI003F8D599D
MRGKIVAAVVGASLVVAGLAVWAWPAGPVNGQPAAVTGQDLGPEDAGLRKFLDAEHGKKPWYPRVRSVHEKKPFAVAVTDQSKSELTAETAAGICSALAGYQVRTGNGITGVQVRASTGETVLTIYSGRDSCNG